MKLLYWSLVIGLSVVFIGGIWGAFFSDEMLRKRGALAEARLGRKTAALFQSAIRILSLLLVIMSAYLLLGLARIFQCAIR